MIYGLVFNCPFGEELHSCPFSKFRSLSLEKRVEAAENLPDYKQAILQIKHNACLAKREAKRIINYKAKLKTAIA